MENENQTEEIRALSREEEYIYGHFDHTFGYLVLLESEEMKDKSSLIVEAVEKVKEFVRRNGKDITTSQLRNIYALALRIREGNVTDLTKLKYKLAYLSGRQKNSREIRSFTTFIDLLADETIKGNKAYHYASFHTVMEALVAYHRFYN